MLLADLYARPIVGFLNVRPLLRQPNEKKLLIKWERIIQELDKYKNKKPKNSLAELENFILHGINEINSETYAEKIPARALNRQSGDIFLNRLNSLRTGMYHRSQATATRVEADAYADVRDYFNSRLGGKYPFADPQIPAVTVEAAAADVKAFYRLYDQSVAGIGEMLDASDRYDET